MKLSKTTLYKRAEPFIDDATLRLEIANDMVALMRQEYGVGLSATQCGLRKRLFVMEINNKVRHCFNPEILDDTQGNMVSMDEGCLSFPGQKVTLVRPSEIQVKYENHLGQVIEETLTGLESRCFQHELDHLNGITMIKRKNNML
jgi:peptide deformylase